MKLAFPQISVGRATIVAGALAISASCSQENTASSVDAENASARFAELSELFAGADVIGEPAIEECTLSGGTVTTCLKITMVAAPSQHEEGPFCPLTIESGPEEGGKWVHDDKVHNVDGPFIRDLATFYDDPEWQMYDPETGEVRAVRGKIGCEVAGDPNSADDNKNTFVECEQKYIETAPQQTYFIPLNPADLAEISGKVDRRSAMGVAFNGVKFDAPAPMELILGGHTLGPFDHCGGHVNPSSGYHYHAVLGCEPGKEAGVKGHSDMIGLAMDGYGIYARDDAAQSNVDDFDQCGGHSVDGLGYHYHAGIPGGNEVLGCFKAENGCTADTADGTCDASAATGRGGPPPGGRHDGPRPEGAPEGGPPPSE
ncbi:MAG: YHYH protein [Erythrobacter sp.]